MLDTRGDRSIREESRRTGVWRLPDRCPPGFPQWNSIIPTTTTSNSPTLSLSVPAASDARQPSCLLPTFSFTHGDRRALARRADHAKWRHLRLSAINFAENQRPPPEAAPGPSPARSLMHSTPLRGKVSTSRPCRHVMLPICGARACTGRFHSSSTSGSGRPRELLPCAPGERTHDATGSSTR